MMRYLHNCWTRFWFTPEGPRNLAICRILFYGGLFIYYFQRHYDGWGVLPEVVHVPRTLFGKLGLAPVLEPETLQVVEWTWKSGLLLSCIGLATRPALIVSAVTGSYLLSLPHDFGKVNHNDQPLMLIMCILALSRCADAYSIDAWLKSRFRPERALPREESGEYRWPVRAAWLVLSLIFFAAGVAKLRFGGIEWLGSQTMQYFLVMHNYPFMSFQPWTDLGLTISQWPVLCSLAACATVTIELFFPLALVHRYTRIFFVAGAFSMQVGIRALLGPHFEQYALVYLFFVPWPAVLDWLHGKHSPSD